MQSLSFVLTLPVFIFVMMMIVQVSQLMIGIVVVHYAAFAAARSAAVWIPAADARRPRVPAASAPMRSTPTPLTRLRRQPNPRRPATGPASGGLTYKIEPGSPKFNKIASAAILACVPISPSRSVGLGAPAATQDGRGLEERLRHARSFRPAPTPRSGRGSTTSWLTPCRTRRSKFVSFTRTRSRRWRLIDLRRTTIRRTSSIPTKSAGRTRSR